LAHGIEREVGPCCYAATAAEIRERSDEERGRKGERKRKTAAPKRTASRTLASGEYLLPCPKCRFPCYVDNEKNIGTCSRQGCSIEFCISCSSKPHTGPCKTPLLATPTKRNSKRLIVGSRQSKRNLRRL
ncbi:F-box only protein, partial [Ooceraea biroi]